MYILTCKFNIQTIHLIEQFLFRVKLSTNRSCFLINYECAFLSTAHEVSTPTAYATSRAFHSVIHFILTQKHKKDKRKWKKEYHRGSEKTFHKKKGYNKEKIIASESKTWPFWGDKKCSLLKMRRNSTDWQKRSRALSAKFALTKIYTHISI